MDIVRWAMALAIALLARVRVHVFVVVRQVAPGVVAAGVIVLLAVPAWAADSTVSLGGLFDLLQPYILAVFSAIATGLVAWLFAILRAKWNIEIDQAHRDALQTALTNAAGLALSKAQGGLAGKTVDLRSPLIAEAVKYVVAAVPTALGHFGLTPEALAQKIAAKIGALTASSK
jgi:hypothetical protein